MKKRLLLVLLAFSVLVVNAVYANWGQSSGGSFGTGNFKAIGTDQVEIEKENLDITLYKDHAKVTVEYLLHNTGDNVVVKAGFPCIVLDEGYDSDKKIIGKLMITRFTLMVKGSPLTLKKDLKFLGRR